MYEIEVCAKYSHLLMRPRIRFYTNTCKRKHTHTHSQINACTNFEQWNNKKYYIFHFVIFVQDFIAVVVVLRTFSIYAFIIIFFCYIKTRGFFS